MFSGNKIQIKYGDSGGVVMAEKKKPGRPKKTENRKTVHIGFRVDVETWAVLQENADYLGMSLSQYVRSLCRKSVTCCLGPAHK